MKHVPSLARRQVDQTWFSRPDTIHVKLDTPKPQVEEEEIEEKSLWPIGAPCIRILGRRCILLRCLLARSRSYLHEVETTERVQAVAASRSVHTCICVYRARLAIQCRYIDDGLILRLCAPRKTEKERREDDREKRREREKQKANGEKRKEERGERTHAMQDAKEG